MKIGIAITTYNRIGQLRRLVERIRETVASPCEIIVCDDGSSDGTSDVLQAGLCPYVGGTNRGIYWNKNRGIHYLLNYTDCDCLILMDDDVWPEMFGWEREWAEACRRFGHVNMGIHERFVLAGRSTASSPGISLVVGGQCMAFARQAIASIGYMDPRFGKYGHEHTELTRRALRAGYGGLLWRNGDGRQERFFVITGGISLLEIPTTSDTATLEANGDLLAQLYGDPIYRQAWRTDQERKEFLSDFDRSDAGRCGKAPVIPDDFDPMLYKAANPDLPGTIDGLFHYIECGRFENRRMVPGPPPPPDGLRSLSIGKPARQSSCCGFSRHDDVVLDAAGAVSGRLTGCPQFHTDRGGDQWWMVDLGVTSEIVLLRIYNRIDTEEARLRFSHFHVVTSADAVIWTEIYRHAGDAPGGIDGRCLDIPFSPVLAVRYLKIVQTTGDFFHLDQVEVYGAASTGDGIASPVARLPSWRAREARGSS